MKVMKTNFIIVLVVVLAGTCRAQDISYGSGALGATIPEGNPTGISFSPTISSAPAGSTVSDVTVGLNISGGYNGDLVAYLQAPNGITVPLIDLPGPAPFGAPGAGFNVVLSDGSYPSIQTATETSGTVFGSGSGSLYNAAGSLSTLHGSAVNGTWTLLFANLGSGGGSPTLNSFSLDILAVPEPANVALAIFGVVMAAIGIARWCVRRQSRSDPGTPPTTEIIGLQ